MSAVDSCAAPPERLRLSWARLERLLFWSAFAGAAAMMWLAPRLPMTDVPAHAAQIALWRDLICGTSRWAGLVYVNLLTPYLIGYGLALPFSFMFSPETAVRIVLTLAFIGFVTGCIGLRRALGSNKRLDWLFLPGFFGFDWKYGFLTFLTAAPVLFAFLILTLRYARSPSLARGTVVVVAGIALLFSHGLIFLFGGLICGMLLLGPLHERWTVRLMRMSPAFVLGVVLVLFVIVTSLRGTAAHYDGWRMGGPMWLRLITALTFILGTNWNLDPVLAALAASMIVSPFFLGCRLNVGPPQRLLAALILVFFALPAFAFQTGFLYARFALFILPFFAFQFRQDDGQAASPATAALAQMAMIGFCLATLAIQASRISAFANESRSFDAVEKAAEPGKRALYLVFNGNSRPAYNKVAVDHFPDWYQADKHGFVDFNFAVFPPQVVRFRQADIPPINQTMALHPDTFDWRKNDGWVYRYFFIRGGAHRVDWLKARSPCRLSLAAADPPWFLVRRDSCPAHVDMSH